MKSLKELNEERLTRAKEVFTSAQIHNWEGVARRDAEANNYAPPTHGDLLLGEYVYMLAYCRRRDKIARAKRDEVPQPFAAGERLPTKESK